MKILKVSRPTKLSARQPFTVYDLDLEPYDEAKRKINGRYFTNVRPGVYRVDESVKISAPHKFKGIKVPPRKRFKNAAMLGLEYRDQPSPGMVDWKDGKIYLADYLKNAPANLRDFVLYHEIGHSRYKNELSCDLYAADKLLKKGDSPEKVAEAAEKFRPNSNVTTKLKKRIYDLK